MSHSSLTANDVALGPPLAPEEPVDARSAEAATTTTDQQPPARSELTPAVAQHAPGLIHQPTTGQEDPANNDGGASTSAPSLFAFFSQLALHDGHGNGKGGRDGPLTHGINRLEGVEDAGMSEEEYSDSSDTESSTLADGSETPGTGDDREDEEDEGTNLGPLPDHAALGKHHVFRPPPPKLERQSSADSFLISNRLAQLAVSNLAADAQGSAGGHDGRAKADDGWTDEDRLAAINDEFGAFEQHFKTMADRGEKEVFLAAGVGGLFRGILIIGNLHLTSHRLTFLARIPPLEPGSTGPLLKSGAVHIWKRRTRLGVPCTVRKRVWLELSSDMATTYPDASEAGRTRPLKTVLLSSIRRIHEEKEPRVMEIELYTGEGAPLDVRRLEFDTTESALAWRREFEAALFHQDRRRRLKARRSTGKEATDAEQESEWERVRISIPLERIETEQTSDYMSFATLVDLQVNNEPTPAFTLAASDASTDSLEKEPSSPSSPVEPLPTANQGESAPARLHIQLALLSSQHEFIGKFERAREEVLQRRRDSCGPGASQCRPPLVDLNEVFRDYLHRGENGEPYGKPDGEAVGAGAGEDVGEQTLRTVFGLGNSEGIWTIGCGLQRALIPTKGQLIVSPQYIGFYRHTLAGRDIKLRFRIEDVKSATKASTMHLSTKGMAIHVHGHPDVLLEFFNKQHRDLAIEHVNDAVATYAIYHPASSQADSTLTPSLARSSSEASTSDASTLLGGPLTKAPSTTPEDASASTPGDVSPSNETRQMSRNDDILTSSLRKATGPDNGDHARFSDNAFNYVPRVVNLPQKDDEVRTGKRVASRHFCMLTIGSRGDVQPYIALALGLMKEGHRCTIITHDEFQDWVEGYGIGFRQAGGDPAALMKLSVEHKMFSPGFFRESLGHFREWLDQLFHDAWVACHDADVLIESPSAMAGIHIAEALKIPYFRAFTMPWTRTHDYPQAFMVPQIEMSGSFYYATYVLFDNIMWKATAGQINRWRRKELGLKSTDMSHLEQREVPFVYNFSSAVVPHPLDWKDNIMISGYWFMPGEETEWTPPDDLDAFMKKARADGKPLVYIGFGSIIVPHPAETTRAVIRAVERADVRAIVAKGWSGRGNEVDKDGLPIEVPFPESCHSLEKVPHDWLFNRIDAAVHHGGAGTTGASLRAGLPTIIKPFFGDQFFWALRMGKLGCGIRVSSLSGNELGDALIKATTDDLMREKAAKIGEKIRAEKGVEKTIEWLYMHLERARDRHQSAHPEALPSTAQPHSHSPCGFLSGSNSRNASPIGSPNTSPTTKGLPAVPTLASSPSGLAHHKTTGVKGSLKEAGSAISTVGRLGSALKGLAKGAGSGSAV